MPEQPDSKTEKKEVERKPTAFVIYRDNELYSRYVSQLIEAIKANGRQVETQVFPRGTSEEVIVSWFEAHKKDFEGKVILFDHTFERSLSPNQLYDVARNGEIPKRGLEPGGSGMAYLDKFFDDIAEKLIAETDPQNLSKQFENVSDEQERVDRIGQTIIKVLAKVLENSENRPRRVIILMTRLDQHYPLNKYDIKSGEDELIKVKLVNWLTQAGIEEGLIEFKPILPNDDNRESVRNLDLGGNWIIMDRHVDLDRQPERARVFLLPLGSLVFSVYHQGLIRFSAEELRPVAQEMVDQDIDQKFDYNDGPIEELSSFIYYGIIRFSKLSKEECDLLAIRLEGYAHRIKDNENLKNLVLGQVEVCRRHSLKGY